MAGDTLLGSSDGVETTQPPVGRTYQVVVAATRDMCIGKDGQLPWRLPSDLKFFKAITSTTSDPGKKNAVVMGRKTWESVPQRLRPLPGRLNVVLTRSRSFEVAKDENLVLCGNLQCALKSLAEPPYNSLIEKVFIIGGGQILREALNAPECDAIHLTEIETSFDCDTFIPPVDLSVFKPWYSSAPVAENNIRYCFATYVRAKASVEPVGTSCPVNNDTDSYSKRLKISNFSFLPDMVFNKHGEFTYLRLMEDIILNGNHKDDRTGTGTISKFGCQPARWFTICANLFHFLQLREFFGAALLRSYYGSSVVPPMLSPLQEQLLKFPRPFPILKINAHKKDIDSFVASDFELKDYNPQQKIEMMKMAV